MNLPFRPCCLQRVRGYWAARPEDRCGLTTCDAVTIRVWAEAAGVIKERVPWPVPLLCDILEAQT